MGVFLILLNIVLGVANLHTRNGFDLNFFLGVFSLCIASWMIGMRAYK